MLKIIFWIQWTILKDIKVVTVVQKVNYQKNILCWNALKSGPIFHVVFVTFSDANFSYIPIVMTMKLCLSGIYVEWHKILKESYFEIENL